MSAEDRREMIADAVIPLLIEHGTGITSRQIAEGVGVAEGTIFRAFGDKDSVIKAAIDKYLDPEPLRKGLAAIDPTLPLEDKVRLMLQLIRVRFSGVVRLMAAIGATERPAPPKDRRLEYATIIARALRPDVERLNCPPERVAHLLRLVAFATSVPPLNQSHPFDEDELVQFVLYGVAGAPADGPPAP
jgi:AcrR family transcriptional regulator